MLKTFNPSFRIIFHFSTESKLACHQPYNFVLNQLISNSFVYNTNTGNSPHKSKDASKFLAIYFADPDTIPSYLISRSYDLPYQFSGFIQNIFGIKTFFSYFYNRMFEQNVPEYKERKEHFQMLVNKLNALDHVNCFASSCLKVMIYSNSFFLIKLFFLTM